MRIDYVYIEDFKNLKKFEIDLDENFMETVLLGQNATGKSNFIESLVLIFKFIDLEKPCVFDYKIKYFCRNYNIEVSFKYGKYDFNVDSDKIHNAEFNRRKNDLLPKYVFTYYSGISDRLKQHFNQHQKRFYDKIIKPKTNKEDIDKLRRMFYVQLVHSYFVLLAYYSFDKQEKKSLEFLENVLGILDLESVLFVLHQPIWKKGKGDEKFWGASGVVNEFLQKVWDLSIAPIYSEERIPVDFRRSKKQKRLYLYISSKKKLKTLSKFYDSNTEFFKALESTYISDLIEEVKVKVKKRDIKGDIKFKELSEGEQQLLTVIGLLKFTKDEESLILLDEPDTHLNPLWKWKYIQYLKDAVKNSDEEIEEDTTQIIINTHDPLLIGGLTKNQVRIFKNIKGKIIIEAPDIDPKGLGVAGILTSELFGLPTILDEETQKTLDKKRQLQILYKEDKLDKEGQQELINLEDELERYGFSKYQRDPLYQKFIEAYYKTQELQVKPKTEEEKEHQDALMIDMLEQILVDQTEENK